MSEQPTVSRAGAERLIERFWQQIKIGEPDECWEWTGGMRTGPYGAFAGTTAHRVAFELVNGPLESSSVFVLHSCDNGLCCNPAHLSAGSQANNVKETWDRGRRKPPRIRRDPATGRILGTLPDKEEAVL